MFSPQATFPSALQAYATPEYPPAAGYPSGTTIAATPPCGQRTAWANPAASLASPKSVDQFEAQARALAAIPEASRGSPTGAIHAPPTFRQYAAASAPSLPTPTTIVPLGAIPSPRPLTVPPGRSPNGVKLVWACASPAMPRTIEAGTSRLNIFIVIESLRAWMQHIEKPHFLKSQI